MRQALHPRSVTEPLNYEHSYFWSKKYTACATQYITVVWRRPDELRRMERSKALGHRLTLRQLSVVVSNACKLLKIGDIAMGVANDD